MLDARQVVQERLTQAVGVAGLPKVAKPPQMLQPVSSTSRAVMVRLSSDELSPIEMSVLARWVICPACWACPGWPTSSIWGFRERQLQVLVDPQRLRDARRHAGPGHRDRGQRLEVSPLTLPGGVDARAPAASSTRPTSGSASSTSRPISTPEELAQVPIEDAGRRRRRAAHGGAAPTLGDVADVVEDHQPLIGDAVCAGRRQCLLLVVEKFPDANTIEVTEGVEEALDDAAPGPDRHRGGHLDLPAGRRSSRRRSRNLGAALLIGRSC